MPDKRLSEDEAVATLADGMTVGIGGWASRRKPMSIVRALLRSPLKNLTIVSYGGPDVVPPELSADVLKAYLRDLQFVLLLVAAAWTAAIWRDRGTRRVAWVIATNLAVNIAFFVSHPLFTQYYTVPVAMLSLWTLLFTTLPARRESAADNPSLAQPAKA